ncbi:MAG: aminopeptidase P family protein [Eubacterium sp.]|nr:aminopeptidase P family protein [Eubacterium sp.]
MPASEEQSRDAIGRILDETEADAVLITDPFNMRYLSGFCGGEGMLYVSRKQKILITDSRYVEQAGRETEFQVVEEKTGHVRTDILRECLMEESVSVIGYEDRDLRCHAFSVLQEKLPQVKVWKPLDQRISRLRSVKTTEELTCLEKAESIGDAAFSEIPGILRPGMTEKEVAAELEYRMKKHGAEGVSFSTIVASGVHSSMPHAVPTDKKLETGDFVTMDFGCMYEGYCSDMTRTVVIGKASDQQNRIYDIVLEAQKACLDGLRAGITGKEADALARTVICKAGYGEYFGHGTGHGVGLYIHEEPRLSPSDLTVLEEGMVVTVEPGIYLPGFGGVRIEDMVVITKTGCRNLTKSPK